MSVNLLTYILLTVPPKLIHFFLTVPPRLIQNREVDRRSNFSVVQGRGVVLPCNVEGDPPPSFSWFKDGSPISPVDIHYFVRQDGSLEIFSADPQDTAEYRCIASNVAGEVDKKMFLFVQGVVVVVLLLLLVSSGRILRPAENWWDFLIVGFWRGWMMIKGLRKGVCRLMVYC